MPTYSHWITVGVIRLPAETSRPALSFMLMLSPVPPFTVVPWKRPPPGTPAKASQTEKNTSP